MSVEASSSSNIPKPDNSISDGELEKLLNREASAFQRELEVERILVAFKLKCVLYIVGLSQHLPTPTH